MHKGYTAWWLTYPSEKSWSSSVGMMTFPIYGKIKDVPNHQPDICNYMYVTSSMDIKHIKDFFTGNPIFHGTMS